MDPALIHKIIVILIGAIGVWLAFWVYFANKKSKVNQLFFLLTISIIAWIELSYIADITDQYWQALIYRRIVLGIVSLFFIVSYFFVICFPKEDKRYPILDKIVFLWGIVFFSLSVFTNLIVKDVEIQEWGSEIIKGKVIDVFYVTIIFLTILIMGLLFKKYFKLLKERRLKIQYFLIGATIFASTNLIFNVFYLIFFKTFKYHWIGDYSTIFLLGFIALAITKRELFEIKVILTDLLVGIMVVVLLIIPFLIDTIWLKILLFITFFFFCIISYLLIRYTHQEARQKEILEQRVEERTKEIEKRKEDLEKFYKLTVGRELRMVELKKKIKELEEKIEKT